MRAYQVDGRVAVIEAGQVLKLTAAQFDSRSHNVDVLRKLDGAFVVRVRQTLQFKNGEHIGIESVSLPRQLASVLVPVHEGPAPGRTEL
jgi:hypothetical protein